jgi:hypothetical protein
MINRLFILSALPLTIATYSILTPNKTIANQSVQVAENVKPSQRQQREQHRPPGPPIDFVTAAKKLGITEANLKEYLGMPAEPPRPDIRGAATKLNITEDKLIEALGLPPRPFGDCSPKKE